MNDHLPHPNTWAADGVDHINLSHEATVEVIQVLNLEPIRLPASAKKSPPSYKPKLAFEHVPFGKFRSIAHFKCFLLDGGVPEWLKQASCHKLYGYIIQRRKTRQRVSYPPHYYALILDAMDQCLQQHPAWKQQLVETTLPFDYYYTITADGLDFVRRERVISANWLINIYTELRNAYREGRAVNVERFLNQKLQHIKFYHGVYPEIGAAAATPAAPVVLLDNLLAAQDSAADFQNSDWEALANIELVGETATLDADNLNSALPEKMPTDHIQGEEPAPETDLEVFLQHHTDPASQLLTAAMEPLPESAEPADAGSNTSQTNEVGHVFWHESDTPDTGLDSMQPMPVIPADSLSSVNQSLGRLHSDSGEEENKWLDSDIGDGQPEAVTTAEPDDWGNYQ